MKKENLRKNIIYAIIAVVIIAIVVIAVIMSNQTKQNNEVEVKNGTRTEVPEENSQIQSPEQTTQIGIE